MAEDARTGSDAAYTAGIGDFVDALDAGSLTVAEQLVRKDALLANLLAALGALERQVGAAGGWRDVHHDRFAGLTVRALAVVEEVLSEIKPLLSDRPPAGPPAPDDSSLQWGSGALVEGSVEGEEPQSTRDVAVSARFADCDDELVRIVDDTGTAYRIGERFVDGRFERRFRVEEGRVLSIFCGDRLLGTYRVPTAP